MPAAAAPGETGSVSGPDLDEPPGRAALLARAEALILGSEPRFTPPEVWEDAGVAEGLARQLWLAMGFPQVPDDEASLTGRDGQALRRAGELLADGTIDAAHLVKQTRVMSQALSTIAASHVEAITAPAGGRSLLSALVDGGADPMPLLDELLSYLYRRHLFAAVERAAFSFEADEQTLAPLAVGFADIAGFSAVTAAATEEELTGLVDEFAAVGADLVAAAGGRVVKLIGDEVMWSVEDPGRAAEVALALVATGERPGAPAVHVGVAWGPVLSHHGDLYGSTVNTASRLTDAARAGTALVDAGLAGSLAGDAGFELRRVRLRPLQGLGTVRAFALRARGR